MAVAVARAENWAGWEALVWLADQVEHGTLAPTLYFLPMTSAEDVRQLPAAESREIWRNLADKARRAKSEPRPMPPAASTYSIHSDDLARFVEATLVDGATAQALGALARQHAAPIPPSEQPPSSSGQVTTEKAATRYDRLLLEILRKLDVDPTTVRRERGGAHRNETKQRALAVALTSEYASQGFTDRTFQGAWERLPKAE